VLQTRISNELPDKTTRNERKRQELPGAQEEGEKKQERLKMYLSMREKWKRVSCSSQAVVARHQDSGASETGQELRPKKKVNNKMHRRQPTTRRLKKRKMN